MLMVTIRVRSASTAAEEQQESSTSFSVCKHAYMSQRQPSNTKCSCPVDIFAENLVPALSAHTMIMMHTTCRILRMER